MCLPCCYYTKSSEELLQKARDNLNSHSSTKHIKAIRILKILADERYIPEAGYLIGTNISKLRHHPKLVKIFFRLREKNCYSSDYFDYGNKIHQIRINITPCQKVAEIYLWRIANSYSDFKEQAQAALEDLQKSFEPQKKIERSKIIQRIMSQNTYIQPSYGSSYQNSDLERLIRGVLNE